MRTRRVVNYNGKNNIVWFGSYGKDSTGKAIFYNKNNKHDNYSIEQQYVSDALTQKLSVIREELWFDINYGLPLIDNVTNKALIDTIVMNIIMQQEGVLDILEFNSTFVGHHYSVETTIRTIYGNVEILSTPKTRAKIPESIDVEVIGALNWDLAQWDIGQWDI